MFVALVTLSSAGRGEEPDASFGLEAALTVNSAYVWRGLNLFADTDDTGRINQQAHHMMLNPALSYTIPDTGLTVGYWGAYQLTGSNRRALIDAGVGAEQDLLATWNLPLGESSALSLGLTYYFYPFAKKESAGTGFPQYIEPAATVTHDLGFFEVGFATAYFHGIPSALDPARHLYLNPFLARSAELGSAVSIEAALGFGFKIWTGERDGSTDNTYDVLTGLALPIEFAAPFTLTPSVNWAWTNFEANSFADEQVFFGSLALGAEL